MEQPTRTSIEQDYFDMRRTTSLENSKWLEAWIEAVEAYRVAYEAATSRWPCGGAEIVGVGQTNQ
jgi:hypothetical protein